MKANFPFARLENSVMAPPLVLLVSVSGRGWGGGGGGVRVRRNSLSSLIIWLKLGLMFGSSTQQDCTMKARLGDIPSGIPGLSCCNVFNNNKRGWFPLTQWSDGRDGKKKIKPWMLLRRQLAGWTSPRMASDLLEAPITQFQSCRHLLCCCNASSLLDEASLYYRAMDDMKTCMVLYIMLM